MIIGPKDYCKFKVKTFYGHTDEVNCVAFSPDFKLIVTGSDDKIVRIFNTTTCELLYEVEGHQGAIRCVAVSPDNEFIASGSYDKAIQLWRISDANFYNKLLGHTKSVEVVIFSPDSNLLCSGSWDRLAIVWNIELCQAIILLTGHNGLVQSAAFSATTKWIATGSWDFSIRIWNLDEESSKENASNMSQLSRSDLRKKKNLKADIFPLKPKPNHLLQKHKGNVHTVAFSGNDVLASGSWDKTVCLWDPLKGQLLHCLQGHDGWVQVVAFSHDNLYVASACEDDTIRIWVVENGKCCKVLATKTETVQLCVFTPHGTLVTSGTNSATSSCHTH
ncbi:WD repeat-containing protein 38-like [Octopus sinensis]|uniref:WD repeat-containing protein 38-like n=1 Tax=Octopus sinensis TaxID=2607531 RepID=A0A7E6F699_9MOLL|nr:WD repeat-containing protein 38-like [Octopus sinensis]